MSISNPEIKKLYGLAAGRCSICKIDVFDNDVHIGEMAHIIAKSTSGARGNDKLTGTINAYENLILLCANHHAEVDQNPNYYTVEKLQKIKSEHEKNIASLFDTPRERKADISFLKLFMNFVPFTQLRYFVENLPTSVNIQLCRVGDMFEAHCIDNPHLYPLNDQNLQHYFGTFIESYKKLWDTISGYTNVNGVMQSNFSQPDDRFNSRIEKRYLPYNEITKLTEILNKQRYDFIDSYNELINFIRANYKEVDLNSYNQQI